MKSIVHVYFHWDAHTYTRSEDTAVDLISLTIYGLPCRIFIVESSGIQQMASTSSENVSSKLDDFIATSYYR